MIVMVVLVVSAAATVMTVRSWERERSARAPVLEALARSAAPGDRVMSPDAGAYRYHGGWSGIVTPDDPLPIVEEALRLYGVRWLALEREHVVSGLRGVLAGEERPAWLSAPLVRASDDESVADAGAAAAANGLPVAALYAVCLAPDDERCRP
jgi:hypothetical protein